MESFYLKIYLFKDSRLPPIKIARNSQLQITAEFMDYTIPEGAKVSAFATGLFPGLVFTQDCTVDGNRVTFTPMPGFFVQGKNILQYKINNGVIPLAIDVSCEINIPDTGDGATPEQVLPYVTRAENAAVSADKSAKDAQDALDKTAEIAVNTPRIGENGNWFVFDAGNDSYVDTGVRAQGESGADGHTPVYGVDYATPEQIDGIAQQAAEILHPEVNQIKDELDTIWELLLDGTNTTSVFWAWWPLSDNGIDTRYQRLGRFGRMLANAWSGKTYTLRGYAAEVSSDTALTPMDDLAGRAPAALATDTDDGGDDWAEEDPMTWYIRANALSLDDGNMNILAIEGEEGFDLSGETAPLYRFSLALFKRETQDESYETLSFRTVSAPGYDPYERDISPDGTKRVLTWAPCCGGGLTEDGKLTSGVGKKPYIFASAQSGLNAARKWDGGNDALWNDGDSDWLLDMWKLRHFDKENSNKLDGCMSYNIQKKVSLAETGVKRVLLSTSDAAGLVAGSTISIGDPGENTNFDRGQAYMRNIAHLVQITSIANVTIDRTDYAAVNLDLEAAIDTTATTIISTMPWHSGSTEKLPGHRDGSIGSLTNGKYPARIAGVEVLNGAYVISIEPLYNVAANEKGGFDYSIHVCRDSKNLSGSITDNHVDTGIRLSGIPYGWKWVKAFLKNKLGILIPRLFDGNSSGWYKSAFCGASSAGVRVPWRWGHLNHGGGGGLACEYAYNSPGRAYWYGSPRLSGSGKKRGELPS